METPPATPLTIILVEDNPVDAYLVLSMATMPWRSLTCWRRKRACAAQRLCSLISICRRWMGERCCATSKPFLKAPICGWWW